MQSCGMISGHDGTVVGSIASSDCRNAASFSWFQSSLLASFGSASSGSKEGQYVLCAWLVVVLGKFFAVPGFIANQFAVQSLQPGNELCLLALQHLDIALGVDGSVCFDFFSGCIVSRQ